MLNIDTVSQNKLFIINIPKNHAEKIGFSPFCKDMRREHFCEYWQNLKDSYEIICNYWNGKFLIEKYNITEYQIYYPYKIKIKVKGKNYCNVCKSWKGKKTYTIAYVDRICPLTKRGYIESKDDYRFYQPEDFTIEKPFNDKY